ncbi:LysE family translocator [Agaribacter flavus]|uniref:LysE family translocator n=1 Tax=Agaribacter flavus TaxID=1902781 RepID=A0ABV7FT86_9ALTE
MFDFSVWLTIAIMHAVAVASPGPDFAVVLKQSLQKGKKAGIWTSIGVGSGILVHVVYSLLGVGLLIQANDWLYEVLLYAAAAYLVWIGFGALRSMPSENQTQDVPAAKGTSKNAFILGFITNGLNPKATLFFLALYSLAIPTDTSLSVKLAYGVYLAVATGLWFVFVSLLASHASIRRIYQQKGYWFDRLMGVVIILMAILLVVSQ